jgi:hypothetical protein
MLTKLTFLLIFTFTIVVLICLKTECPVVTRDEVFEVISKCHIQACQKSKNICGDTPLLKSICNCASMCNTLRCSVSKHINTSFSPIVVFLKIAVSQCLNLAPPGALIPFSVFRHSRKYLK